MSEQVSNIKKVLSPVDEIMEVRKRFGLIDTPPVISPENLAAAASNRELAIKLHGNPYWFQDLEEENSQDDIV